MIDISFVILTCNSQESIEPCIRTYARSIDQQGLKAEFLIVDNGSKDQTIELLRDQLLPALPPSCQGEVICLPKNLGTTKSRNLAFKKASGNFYIVCDSDTEFIKGDWQKAIQYLNEHEEAGLLAARLFYRDNSTQQSVKRFPTLPDKMLKLRKTFFGMKESTTDYYEFFDWDEAQPVDTAISAFWMFPRALLAKIGLLDEQIFYAPEDVDFCLRSWKAGRKVVYYPDIYIRHKTQRLSHSKPLSKVAISHFFDLLYYFNKHNYWLSREKIYAQIPAHTY